MKKFYKNPILLCDYSDPDVIRVGDTYFLTASSFNFVPGLPVLTSKNLVDWKLVNYAAKKIPLPGYDKVQNAKGIWAPSIRFHDGVFYIFFATPDEGIFEVHAKNPFEEWSEWNCVWSGKGFIDPCPLWDDDSRLWLVHAYAKSRIGFNSKLGLLELDPKTFHAISEDKFIFDGTESQPTIEGPKFYKKDGFYYIFAPAGGVSEGWQTVLRSKKIDGDYEEKIVLVQGKSKTNGPHQGGWVQSELGEDWFVHFQDRGIFGRITHLEPMRWLDNWPVMGTSVSLPDEKALLVTGEPVKKWKMPFSQSVSGINRDKTAKDVPLDEFQFSASKGSGFSYGDGTIWLNPRVCTKKLDSKKFKYVRKIVLTDFLKDSENKEPMTKTGIVFLGNEYAALCVEKRMDGFHLVYLESEGSEAGDEKRTEKIIFDELLLQEVSEITLKMKFNAESDKTGVVKFSCRSKQLKFKSKKFRTTNAHWVGGRYGYFFQ